MIINNKLHNNLNQKIKKLIKKLLPHTNEWGQKMALVLEN